LQEYLFDENNRKDLLTNFAEPGGAIQVEYNAFNSGFATCTDFTVTFYLSENKTITAGGDTPIGTRTHTLAELADINPTTTLTVPSGTLEGDYYVGWIMSGGCSEYTTENNTVVIDEEYVTVSISCVADGYEPDDTDGEAKAISSGSPQSHSICPVGDQDWVTFTLDQASEVVIETSGSILTDTDLWLYDSGLSEIEFDDYSGTGLHAKIDRECGTDELPAGTYYAMVGEYLNDGEIVEYQLELNVSPCAAGYGDELAADFGGDGLHHYDGVDTWNKIAIWDPDDDLAGWGGGLAVDFGAYYLWNHDGSGWSKLVNWDAEDLEGCHNGLYADFGGYGLWYYDGTTWSKRVSWAPENLACWSGGLAVDFGTYNLWNYDGTSWSKLVNWNPGPDGLAGWPNGLAVDFDGSGLWNYDGSGWTKMAGWDAEGVEGSPCGLGADFGTNGLWVHDGTTGWSKASNWDPEGQSALGSGHAVDFGANGIYDWDCAGTWNRISTVNPENMDDVNLN
jgi:hypothetical protein